MKEKIQLTVVPSNISDHYALRTHIEQKKKIRKYERIEKKLTNYQQIQKQITKMEETTINTFEELSSQLKKIIETNETTENIKRREECPWINKNLIKQIKQRNKIYKKKHKISDKRKNTPPVQRNKSVNEKRTTKHKEKILSNTI